MKTLLIVAVALVVSTNTFAQRDGNTMVSECGLAVARDNGQKLDTVDEMLGALGCTAYVAGYLDALHLMSDLGKGRLFCQPEDRLSVTQAERIFTKYLEAHPEQLHKSAEFLLSLSLVEAFPCKGSPPK